MLATTSAKQCQCRRSNVKVIYTGGTIGMIRNEKNVLAPIPHKLVELLHEYPNMHDKAFADTKLKCKKDDSLLVMPKIDGYPNRIIYTISEYEPLLDSSNMGVSDWIRIAQDIRDSYKEFDAFVILHGTDTLAYTASALSFMLEDLGKTVILTGSQIPIFEARSDGNNNFTTAILIAGNFVIPEVCIYFDNKLMRGNRTIKVNCDSFHAFETPNFPPLAEVGIKVEVDYRLIEQPSNIASFAVHTHMDMNVGLLRIFPSITSSTVRAFMLPPMRGVVLLSFGSGNIPSNRPDIINELKGAVSRGVLIVNCTQCSSGTATELYETGSVLSDLGAVSGWDMTPEAAVTKLSYVLSKKEWDMDYKKQVLRSNIRGELTSAKFPPLERGNMVEAIGKCLHMTSPAELAELRTILYPAMLAAAVVKGDIPQILHLKKNGADLSTPNKDYRTPLHIACHEGNYKVVECLLQHGALLHIRDRHERTPLMEAIATDRHDVIQMMVKCGAHLTGPSYQIGTELCLAAGQGSLLRLQSYKLAGADLGQQDLSGRTALHVAAAHQHVDVVQFLLKSMTLTNGKDILGLTALEYAKNGNNPQIISMLTVS